MSERSRSLGQRKGSDRGGVTHPGAASSQKSVKNTNSSSQRSESDLGGITCSCCHGFFAILTLASGSQKALCGVASQPEYT